MKSEAQKSLSISLGNYGIQNVQEIIYNPSFEQLAQYELDPYLEGYEKGQVSENGAINVMTGIFTGRSPKDKYIVEDVITKNTIWWNTNKAKNDNKPITENTWEALKENTLNQLQGKKLYVVDAFCGANENSRLKVRFIMEVAWQAHFVTNMFIRPTKEELENFGEPDFIVMNGSKTSFKDYANYGLNSEVYIAFNLTEKMQLIGGTWYGGEMKKGIFSIMNYYLPLRGIASMHCSANKGKDGDVAIFFGLSGTGKTTLSTDPKRELIGDDEHGWDDEGVFNFEGGCYAKTLDLCKDNEPDIYNAIKRDALLENVTLDENGNIDYNDGSVTQNTRVSYPIYHIENIVKPISKAGHASKVIFLTADAFGVMPAVSKLTPEQTKYYFLSGFTSKLAGTELGVTQPEPTFSACFGKAFLSLHPRKYAEELVYKMEQNNSKAYMVNTGWNGSRKRISIKETRAIIDAILDGSIEKVTTTVIPIFNLEIPNELPNVNQEILDPRNSYLDVAQWNLKATDLASRFIKNFNQYTDNEECVILEAVGPQIEEEEIVIFDK